MDTDIKSARNGEEHSGLRKCTAAEWTQTPEIIEMHDLLLWLIMFRLDLPTFVHLLSLS